MAETIGWKVSIILNATSPAKRKILTITSQDSLQRICEARQLDDVYKTPIQWREVA